MKAIEIELAVARLFDFRKNIIVPNICWGAGLHECDILIVRKTGYAIEVEIKTTKSDLKKDAGKRHNHESNKIKELFFAVPEPLGPFALETLPVDIGVIIVTETTRGRFAHVARKAAARCYSRPFTAPEIHNVARLGTMRIWGLKAKLIKK